MIHRLIEPPASANVGLVEWSLSGADLAGPLVDQPGMDEGWNAREEEPVKRTLALFTLAVLSSAACATLGQARARSAGAQGQGWFDLAGQNPDLPILFVLVLHTKHTCSGGHCVDTPPDLPKIRSNYSPLAESKPGVFSLVLDQEEQARKKFWIQKTPAVLLVSGKEVLGKFSGNPDPGQLKALAGSHQVAVQK